LVLVVYTEVVGVDDAGRGASAPTSSAAAHATTGCFADREVKHVDVVGQAGYRDAAVVVKVVDGCSRHVALISTITSRYLAGITLATIFAGNKVDRLQSVAVFKAAESSLVALRVKYLHVL